ncbi:MAG: methylmalonyl-CoA mutase family protein [bacterium]|nr:methylmalonyl-CoA mutase family protein [bacterium]
MTKDKGYFRPDEILLDYEKDLGDPGKFPYGRGLYEGMYRDRKPTIRQFAGYGLASDTNQRFKMLLAEGGTGLSTAFDLPTLMGRDSDDPLCRGQVGWDGVAIDTIEDIKDLFDGIPLDQVTVSMTINAPAAVLLAMYIAFAEERGIPLAHLGGTLQADILKEYAAQKEWRFPVEYGVDLLVDIIEYATTSMPKWHPVSISGYHIREAGATAVEEVAYTLSDAIVYVERMLARGMKLEQFAPRLSFFFDAHNNFFEEIAKLRAARMLWARIMRLRFGAPENSRADWCRMHVQTAGCTLTRDEPQNNIVRVAIQAMAAMFGGAQSIHTNSYDEVLCTPTEEAVRIAIRTQQILQQETGICQFPDPLGGSYLVEHLTQKIVAEAGAEIERVRAMGGMVSAILRGYPQGKIRSSALANEEAQERKELVRVGENTFSDGKETAEPKNILTELKKRMGFEGRQLERLKQVKQTRSEIVVRKTLAKVRSVADDRAGGVRVNMLPCLIEAAKARATVGEMMNVLENSWGRYQEQEIWSPHSKEPTSGDVVKKYRLPYPLRILLAKGGLDGHDRPIYTLAELFKNLGAEVILPGLHCSLEEIAERALEEDVDVVGISTHIGSPLVIMKNIRDQLTAAGKGDVLMLGGGIIRAHEREALKSIGVEHFFTVGVSHESIAQVLFEEAKMLAEKTRRQRGGKSERQRLTGLLTLVSRKPHLIARYLGAKDIPPGRAHVVGITGSTAIGKSTLIDKMIALLRADNLKVIVLAIDPTEEESGGAILGDIIRMRRHYTDQGVFMRSFGSHGASGSVTAYLKEAVAVARRFADVVIVETVGAGQADTALKHCVDTFVSLPDTRGDMVNLLKSGHHRHADILVVNMRAESPEEKNFAALVKNFSEMKDGWMPPVFSVNAQTGEGVRALIREGLYAHKKFLEIPAGTAK